MNKYYLSILFIFLTLSSFSQDYKSEINAIVSSNYEENSPGISILVSKDGKSIYKNAFGLANLKSKNKTIVNSVFQIGSITKQFTAVAILMLAEQGKLNVTDEIVKYLPIVSENWQGITIHQLLNHTSGIKNESLIGNKEFTSQEHLSPTELINYFKNKPLDFKPGDSFNYSNAGYILLGQIIETVSKQSYAEFIKNSIFKKIGMNSSFYGSSNLQIKNKTTGYIYSKNSYFNSATTNLSLAYSAGAILSTTEDLLKWQNALITNDLIKKSSLQLAMRPTVLNNGKRVPYGYGFRFGKLGNSPVIAHTGSTKGYTSIALFLPKEKVYVVALSNCNCKNINDVAKQVAKQFVKVSGKVKSNLNKGIKKERPSISVSIEKLKKYVGTYQVRPNVNLTIGLDEKNQLFLLAPNQTKRIELYASKENHFFVKVVNVEVTFNLENTKTVSLTMHQSGRKINAKKN